MKPDVFERHKQAISTSLTALIEMIEKIDQALLDVDTYMNALQPKMESGRMRVFFVDRAGEQVPEMRSMYRTRSEGGWHSKRVNKGFATRTLRRTGPFEPNYQAVKVLCGAAESLIAERANLMIRLRSVSSAMRESVKGAVARIEKIDRQHVEPFRQILEPDDDATD